jgi:hypothetical protein
MNVKRDPIPWGCSDFYSKGIEPLKNLYNEGFAWAVKASLTQLIEIPKLLPFALLVGSP